MGLIRMRYGPGRKGGLDEALAAAGQAESARRSGPAFFPDRTLPPPLKFIHIFHTHTHTHTPMFHSSL